jgi:two-component system OmpR family sensor kinase
MTLQRRGAVDVSLFVQLLALMAGAVIFAQAASFIVIYLGPPPTPETHNVTEIVNAYFGQEPEDGRPALVVTKQTERIEQSRPTSEQYRNGLRRDLENMIEARGGPEINWRLIRIRSAAPRWVNDRFLVQRRDPLAAVDQSERFIIAPFSVAFPEADGTWRVVSSPPGIRLDPWQQRALMTVILTALVVMIAAYLFARRLSTPFARLAESAERLGRDPGAPPLKVSGPSEAKVAAKAFNDMQDRLRRYVEDRTAMVGAIAHDMRTPLTRLRFRIEGAPDELKEKMSSDLDQMEAMISATLSFVRDATQPAQRTKLELSSVLESLVDEMAETGSEVEMQRSDKVVIEGDPVALKRMYSNLLENAMKYGKQARVRVFKDAGNAIVEIDDDGPGVPHADLERVFEPFYRREPSRNRDTGGIGLGLAVVRTVARAHGGDAELENRAGGGLTARVRLPI